MGTFSWQTWNSGPFSIERKPGSKPGTVILCFHGPFTLRDAYSSLPTMSLKQVLELEPAPGEAPPVKNILDLTGCPYMDSSGLGIIVSHMVHCNKKGMKMIAAGMTRQRGSDRRLGGRGRGALNQDRKSRERRLRSGGKIGFCCCCSVRAWKSYGIRANVGLAGAFTRPNVRLDGVIAPANVRSLGCDFLTGIP